MSSLDPAKEKIDELSKIVNKLNSSYEHISPQNQKHFNTIVSIQEVKNIVTLLEEYKNIMKSYKPLPFEQTIHIGKKEPEYVTKEDLTIRLETLNTHITYLSKTLDSLKEEVRFNSQRGYY